MPFLFKFKRFWALIAFLGFGILLTVLVVLKWKKRSFHPTIYTTVERSNSINQPDKTVFKSLRLEMIKDEPSMAIMFLFEKICSEDIPKVPLPSKQLLRSFYTFEYEEYKGNLSSPILAYRLSVKILSFFIRRTGA